jgi:CBS domain-containing protein
MDDNILDEEFSIMYQESDRTKVLDAKTFLKPIKNLKVRKPLTLDIGKTVQDALDFLIANHTSCLLITREEVLVGIVTERDIITKALPSGKPFTSFPIDEIMTRNPECFQPDDSVAFVLNAMHIGGYRHIPVVDDRNRPLAIVSVRDIISFIVEHFSEAILNLPPKPMRGTRTQDGG